MRISDWSSDVCSSDLVVAEYRVLVRVERHRLTVRLDILPGRVHVGKGALALDHLQMHQLAGRIIDVNQQRALRPAILKPPVLRAIELARSEEHTSELQSLMRISYAVFCLKKKT